MARHLKRRMAGASLALFSLIQGGTAQAAHKITGKDIKNGSLSFNDFKSGEVASAQSVASFKTTLRQYAVKWNNTLTDVVSEKASIASLTEWKLGADTLLSSMKDSVASLASWKLDTDATLAVFKNSFLKIDDAASQFLKVDGTAANAIKWNGLTTDQVILGDGSVRTANATATKGTPVQGQKLTAFGDTFTITVSYDPPNAIVFGLTNTGDNTLEVAEDGSATSLAHNGKTSIPVSLANGGGLATLQVIDATDPSLSATVTVSATLDVEAINLHATILGSGQ